MLASTLSTRLPGATFTVPQTRIGTCRGSWSQPSARRVGCVVRKSLSAGTTALCLFAAGPLRTFRPSDRVLLAPARTRTRLVQQQQQRHALSRLKNETQPITELSQERSSMRRPALATPRPFALRSAAAWTRTSTGTRARTCRAPRACPSCNRLRPSNRLRP